MKTPMSRSTYRTLITVLVCALGLMVQTQALYAQSHLPSIENPAQPFAFNKVGLSILKQIDPNLTGENVNIAVVCRSLTYINGLPQNDYRPDTSHNCLTTARFNFHDQPDLPPGISPHSTAICSILFGLDPFASHSSLGDFQYQGVVPNAQGNIYELWHFLKNNVHPQIAPNAQIITASFGIEREDWWTRGIESMAQHDGILVIAGIGNGTNVYHPPLYPGASANTIGVGVVNSVAVEDLATKLANFALVYPENSSCGPTTSRRCKPDIVAPGNCLVARAGEPETYEPTGDFSSFATPMVAGAAGLLIQKAMQEPELYPAISPKAGNCVIKAILLNSATKLPFWHKGRLSTEDDHTAPLDYIQGAGMLNALNAYLHLISGRSNPGNVMAIGWDNNMLQAERNPDNTYRFNIDEPTDEVITVTAVWNKHYSRIYPFNPQPKKDADMRLELWAIDSNDPNSAYLLDYSDSTVDNVEHICVAADPNCTEYEIVLSLNNADDQETQADAIQRYGLAWSVGKSQNGSNIHWYDLNADGVVDKDDLAMLIGYCVESKQSDSNYMIGDVNADGMIDTNDVQVLMDHANTRADWRAEQPGEL